MLTEETPSNFRYYCVLALVRRPPHYLQLEVNPDLMHWPAVFNAIYLQPHTIEVKNKPQLILLTEMSVQHVMGLISTLRMFLMP